MDIADNGTWCIHIDRDLKGSFYTFQIEKDGKWLDETPGIWAKAVGINGNRAAVIDWNELNHVHILGYATPKVGNQTSHPN